MTSPSHRLHKMVAYLDKTAGRLVQSKFGISYNRTLFLVILQSEEPLTQHGLATALGYSDAAVSLMVTELIASGYVDISIDSKYGRKRIVKLTPDGSSLATKIRTYLDSEFETLLTKAGVDIVEYDKLNEKIYKCIREKEDNTND